MKKITKISFLLLLTVLLASFGVPKKLLKKVTKEIRTTYQTENYTLSDIVVPKSFISPIKLTENNLFLITSETQKIGYCYLGKAASKTDEFDYMVLFNANLNIVKVKVLIYREDYGNEIGSKRWLKQFIGLSGNTTLRYGDNVDAIAGATISANSMTVALHELLETIQRLHKNNII